MSEVTKPIILDETGQAGVQALLEIANILNMVAIKGKDGNGIASAVLNADYTLTLTFDDGTSYTTPSIRGATGQRGTGLLAVTTAPSSYTTEVGGIIPAYRMAISTIKTQAGVTEVLLGDTIRYSYYHYPIVYVDASYAYCRTRVNIRGATGAAYTLTDADKTTIANAVKDSLTTETWTFTLADGSTVTKKVLLG